MLNALRKIKKIWIQLGEFLGNIVGTVLLTIIYIVIIGPLKILSFVARKDFLRQKQKGDSYWIPAAKENVGSLQELELPF